MWHIMQPCFGFALQHKASRAPERISLDHILLNGRQVSTFEPSGVAETDVPMSTDVYPQKS
jgi:hypothetical protein